MKDELLEILTFCMHIPVEKSRVYCFDPQVGFLPVPPANMMIGEAGSFGRLKLGGDAMLATTSFTSAPCKSRVLLLESL